MFWWLFITDKEVTFMKKVFTFTLILFAALNIFALPGITQYIPDASGEYVFYRDSSFKRTSYVGFICYDERTYAARYYSPFDFENALPETDISLYITVDETKDHMEFTGETMNGVTTENDTEIVNYLHDLLYEFNSRRQKANVNNTDSLTVTEDFAQFGGNVSVVYNALIPLFNIESIKAADGSFLFQLVTMGALVNSQDTSFNTFKGFDRQTKDTTYKFTSNPKAKKVNASFEDLKITIDNQWTQDMENMWELGENALLVLNTIEIPEGYSEQLFYDTLTRKLLLGTQDSFANIPRNSITKKDNKTIIMNVYYQPATNTGLRDFKIIVKTKKNGYRYVALTTYENVYDDNRDYFNKIIDSIK